MSSPNSVPLRIEELGATISRTTDAGNFALLLAATILMAAIVATVNRTV